MIIPMESIKTPKRIIKKQIKNVNKAIIEIAEMKFEILKKKKKNNLLQIFNLYYFVSATFLKKSQ